MIIPEQEGSSWCEWTPTLRDYSSLSSTFLLAHTAVWRRRHVPLMNTYYCNVTTLCLVHGLYLSQSFLAQISFNYTVVWSKPNETMKLYAIKNLLKVEKFCWSWDGSSIIQTQAPPSLSLSILSFYHSFMGWKEASLHGRNEIKMASRVLCKFVIAMFFHQKQKHNLFMKPMQHYFFMIRGRPYIT